MSNEPGEGTDVGEWALAYFAVAEERDAERALADELAAALARSVPSLIHDPETEAVMARYQEARQQ